MVAVFVGDQDAVGLGEGRIVDLGRTHLEDGVDLDVESFVAQGDGTVVDHRDRDLFAGGRGELCNGKSRLLHGAGNGGRNGEQGGEQLEHK